MYVTVHASLVHGYEAKYMHSSMLNLLQYNVTVILISYNIIIGVTLIGWRII